MDNTEEEDERREEEDDELEREKGSDDEEESEEEDEEDFEASLLRTLNTNEFENEEKGTLLYLIREEHQSLINAYETYKITRDKQLLRGNVKAMAKVFFKKMLNEAFSDE